VQLYGHEAGIKLIMDGSMRPNGSHLYGSHDIAPNLLTVDCLATIDIVSTVIC